MFKEQDYELYQIVDGDEMHYHRFQSLSAMLKMATYPEYKCAYAGSITVPYGASTGELLEKLYEELNINHPPDYRARSLSVSDIVKLNGTHYYCDRFGWEVLDVDAHPFFGL